MYNFLGDGFIGNLLARMSEFEKKKKRESAGITTNDLGLEGISHLNIPHIYQIILIEADGYLRCLHENGEDMYDKDGKLLFQCNRADYLKHGMFLVSSAEDPKHESDNLYSLYDGDTKLTEPIFRSLNMSYFNEFGFCVIGIGKKFSYGVINRKGEILNESNSLHRPYVDGVICKHESKYINLLTKETICEGGYQSVDTDDFIFTKVESNCVYQINKRTGEFNIHGELNKKEEPKETPARIDHKTGIITVNKPTAGRNDDCPSCKEKGIKIKFKKCKEHFNQQYQSE